MKEKVALYHVTPGVRLVLASGSPRRRQMFRELGIECTLHAPDIDETILPGERPAAVVSRLSREKALAAQREQPDSWILAADTIVVFEGEILGKPRDEKEAYRFLTKIQGSVHEVYGGFHLLSPTLEESVTQVSISEVTLRPLSHDLIERYIQTGEPMDKAGAYAVQGIGSSFIERVSGSYTNVVGLDLTKCLESLFAHSIITLVP